MFGLYHAFDEDFEINGYCIPKDAIVIPSIIMCHHDPDYWEDPKIFKPERFITPELKLDLIKKGRRNCIGESLARTEFFILVVGLLQTFIFEAPEGVELNTEPDKNRTLFLNPYYFKIIMTVRDHISMDK
ncbi:cytochrome P450 2L1 [Armadillidium vulgare]|nr:cytochrome P450 2L1 [Armadillidium vulgare]